MTTTHDRAMEWLRSLLAKFHPCKHPNLRQCFYVRNGEKYVTTICLDCDYRDSGPFLSNQLK